MIDFTKDIGPDSLENFNVHQKHIATLLTWCDKYRDKTLDGSPVFVINGPHGSGKSTMIRLIIKHLGYDPVYFEPNFQNTHKVEIERLKGILSGGNVLMMIHTLQKAVVFQDVEIGASGDRGFLNDIIQLTQKKIKFKNPLFVSTNTSIKNKKLQSFAKSGFLVQLDRITNYELFKCGRWINQQYNLLIPDHQIQWMANSSQGDLRSLVQTIEMTVRNKDSNPKKNIGDYGEGSESDIEGEIVLEKEGELKTNHQIVSSVFEHYKDLEMDPLKDLQRYLLPTIPCDFDSSIKLFDNEPNFVPANLYHNSWELIKNVKFEKKDGDLKYYVYQTLLEHFSNWALLSNKYPNYHSTYHYEYKCALGLFAPMTLIRHYRQKHGFKVYNCRTSNMFSRQSQSNFNIKSMNELSCMLKIPNNCFHDFTYIIAQIIIQSTDEDLYKQLAQFLVNHNITCVEFDRLIKYNCLYYLLEKSLSTKKKNSFKKLIRNTAKNLQLEDASL